jgi:hypothetical protein
VIIYLGCIPILEYNPEEQMLSYSLPFAKNIYLKKDVRLKISLQKNYNNFLN